MPTTFPCWSGSTVADGTVSAALQAALRTDNSAREFDPTPMINYANDSFIGVIIQYRLGAFGFLNSPEMVAADGLNAGITDAAAALRWVQKYIGCFGGDGSRVTIWGQSSGGGTILHLIAAQATAAERIWRSAVVSSPYLVPMGRCDSAFWQVSLRGAMELIEDTICQLQCRRGVPKRYRVSSRCVERPPSEPQPHVRLDPPARSSISVRAVLLPRGVPGRQHRCGLVQRQHQSGKRSPATVD